MNETTYAKRLAFVLCLIAVMAYVGLKARAIYNRVSPTADEVKHHAQEIKREAQGQ
jgi:hypothetical protein